MAARHRSGSGRALPSPSTAAWVVCAVVERDGRLVVHLEVCHHELAVGVRRVVVDDFPEVRDPARLEIGYRHRVVHVSERVEVAVPNRDARGVILPAVTVSRYSALRGAEIRYGLTAGSMSQRPDRNATDARAGRYFEPHEQPGEEPNRESRPRSAP